MQHFRTQRSEAVTSSHQQLLSRVSIDPATCGGRPHIRGTGIPIDTLLDRLAEGTSIDAVVAAHPPLQREDVQAALAWAAELMRLGEPHVERLQAALAEGLRQADRGELVDGRTVISEMRRLLRSRSGADE